MIPAIAGGSDDLRTRLAKGMLVGGSLSVGAAVVWSVTDLMRRNPTLAFALLQQWGPWFVLAVIAMYLVWDISKRLLDKLDRMAEATLKQADGMNVLSLAVTKIAEKDDRQHEEMVLLVQHAARTAQYTVRVVEETKSHQVKMFEELNRGQQELRDMMLGIGPRRRATDEGGTDNQH